MDSQQFEYEFLHQAVDVCNKESTADPMLINIIVTLLEYMRDSGLLKEIAKSGFIESYKNVRIKDLDTNENIFDISPALLFAEGDAMVRLFIFRQNDPHLFVKQKRLMLLVNKLKFCILEEHYQLSEALSERISEKKKAITREIVSDGHLSKTPEPKHPEFHVIRLHALDDSTLQGQLFTLSDTYPYILRKRSWPYEILRELIRELIDIYVTNTCIKIDEVLVPYEARKSSLIKINNQLKLD